MGGRPARSRQPSGSLLSNVVEVSDAQELLDLGVERLLAIGVFLPGGVNGLGAGFAEQVANQHAALAEV